MMWGAPNEFGGTDSLSVSFVSTRFCGGDVNSTLGAWDYSINYPMYKVYTSILPRVLNLLRTRSRKNTVNYLIINPIIMVSIRLIGVFFCEERGSEPLPVCEIRYT
jgi:hypothetical protein